MLEARLPAALLLALATPLIAGAAQTMRAEVGAKSHVIAAGRHFAVEAGMRMFRQGGNAFDAGAAAVMPLGAPIGSGMGLQNQAHIRILREMITAVPLIIDAGVGTASDAAIAMELGADAVLMNTGIAAAQEPVLMAEAMKHGVIAGRQAYLAGRMPRKLYATASSPLEGIVR